MNVLHLDTNVVSILFNKNHSLRKACIDAVTGQQLVISFMTRAELMLWPTANNWGESRRAGLAQHLTCTRHCTQTSAHVQSGPESWINVDALDSRSRLQTPGSLPLRGNGAFLW